MIRYPTVNRLFTIACFATPPILGSVVSFIWHGGALWCTFEVVSGRRRLSNDRFLPVMTACLYLYAIWSAMSAVVNGIGSSQLDALLPLATFALFPFSYSIWTISHKTDIMRAGILASAAASYGACIVALLQFYLYNMRAEGGAGNTLVFAPVVGLAGTLCLAGAFTLERRLAGLLIGGYFASMISVIYSGARMPFLAVVAATLFLLWVYRKQIRSLFSVQLAVLTAVLTVVVVLLCVDLIWPHVRSLIHNWHSLTVDHDYNNSLGLRVALWQIGYDLVRESPLVGHGLQSTADLAHRTLEARFAISRNFTHFHNGILTVAIESGLVGAGAILAFFAVMATNAWRTIRDGTDTVETLGGVMLALVVIVSLLSGMTNLIVGHDILNTVLMVFAIVGTYLASGVSSAPRPAFDDRQSSDRAENVSAA